MYHLPTSYLLILILFSIFHHLPCASSQGLGWCDTLFQCGNIKAGFPFWGGNRYKDCGHPSLELHCNKNNITSIFISNQEYSLLNLDQTSNTITLAKKDLQDSFCSSSSTFKNTTLPPNIFELSPAYKSVTVLYHCSSNLLPSLSSYTCPEIGPISVSENPEYLDKCNASFTLNVPKSFDTKEKMLNMTNLESVLRKGFEVKAKTDEKACQECVSSHGRCHGFNEGNLTLGGVQCHAPVDSEGSCGYNKNSTTFMCYCKDPYSLSCGSRRKSFVPWIIGGVSVLIFVGALVSFLVWFRVKIFGMR